MRAYARRAPGDEARDLPGAAHGDAAGTAANLVLHVAALGAAAPARRSMMKRVGLDVGSTTVKAVLVEDGRGRLARLPAPQHPPGREGARVPRAHGGRGAASPPGATAIFFTGSGAGLIAPLVGGKLRPGGRRRRRVRGDAAPRRALRLRDRRRGHEDASSSRASGDGKSKQVYMQSACSGGTGTFIEKTARKLQVADRAAGRDAATTGLSLHKISSQVRHLRRDRRQHAGEDRRAGRGDHREPLRGGGLPEPRHADQGQHADARRCCCWAGPTCSSRACRRRGAITWRSSGRSGRSRCPRARSGDAHPRAGGGALLRLPRLRRDRPRRGRRRSASTRGATSCAGGSTRASTSRRRKDGAHGPGRGARTISRRSSARVRRAPRRRRAPGAPAAPRPRPVLLGCDFGSTTAKAVVLSPERRAALQLLRARPRATRSRTRRRCSARCAAAGFTSDRRARAHRLRQGPAEGRARRRRRRRRDGGARHGGAALLPRRRRDLRRRRHATSRS